MPDYHNHSLYEMCHIRISPRNCNRCAMLGPNALTEVRCSLPIYPQGCPPDKWTPSRYVDDGLVFMKGHTTEQLVCLPCATYVVEVLWDKACKAFPDVKKEDIQGYHIRAVDSETWLNVEDEFREEPVVDLNGPGLQVESDEVVQAEEGDIPLTRTVPGSIV